MTRTVFSICSAAFLATACAPLMQAPLVYSSKIQGGLNVTTTSAETPGVEISLGFKALDAAYVPVAVARPCESRKPSECTAAAYDVVPIFGGNKESSGTVPTAEELARAERAYDDARNARALASGRLELAVNDRDEARTRKDSAQSAREEATQVLAAAPQDDPTKVAAANLVATGAEANYEQAVRTLAAAELARGNSEAAFNQASGSELIAKAAVETIRQALAGSTSDDKEDALSVFGSFDGGAGTTTKTNEVTASLTMGKVFSTGVAAQNLTQGMGDSASRSATADCFKSGMLLVGKLPDAEQAAKAKDLLTACGLPTP